MNLFVALRKDDGSVELITPPLDDVILPGVTRDSVLCLARDHASGNVPIPGIPKNLTVSERYINMGEIVEASKKDRLLEVFGTGACIGPPAHNSGLISCLGTAAIICPVERIGYEGRDIKVPTGENGQGIGDLAKSFLSEVQGRQIGKIPSKWSFVVSE